MSDYFHLVSGYKNFMATTYEQHKDLVTHLVQQGSRPTTLFIACCDLRISPDSLVSCNPGDLYVIRNVAALVPPYEESGTNGTIAAIEYAVNLFEVKNIVVLGHAHCDGIKTLMSNDFDNIDDTQPIKTWLSIANDARKLIKDEMEDDEYHEQVRSCETESILVSVKNLLSYPWLVERVKKKELNLYGWHFDIETGELLSFDPKTKFFEKVQ